MTVTRMRCGAVASLALALFGSACHSLRAVDTNELGPIGRLDVSDGPHGSMIATMGQGTSGNGVFQLPSGDLLLAGQGETGFLQRLTPDGRARWTMQTCWGPNVAFATDDVIYASAPTFLDAGGRIGEPVPVRRHACGPQRTPNGVRTSVVRLDGHGNIQWKRDTGLSDSLLQASPDHVFVLGSSGGPMGSKLMAFTPRGQIAWTWQGQPWSSTAVWSPAHHMLVAGEQLDDEAPVPRACFLTALDEATGKPVWEKTIQFSGSEGSTPMRCSVRQILVSPRGGIFLVDNTGSTYEYVIIGFDLSTGAERWRRTIDVTDFVPSANAPLIAMPGMPLLLETQRYDTFQAGLGGNPVIVALDPDTGREALVAVFRGDLSENHDIDPETRLAVNGFAWGHDTVVATGYFRGRVVAGDLRADSESTVETLCIDIDPGSGPGAPLEDAHGRCKFGSERLRVYGSTLFVARVPVIRPR